MPGAKAFLLQECDNVALVLEETLRYKYGPEGSRDFYEECRTRLEFIASELASAAETDWATLMIQGGLLNTLSRLIWRIERSSLGEYSWPFVYELKALAKAVCSEPTLTQLVDEPLIHVIANGGLDSYAIQAEPRRPSGSGKRIHTIVFPSSLKHFVLLHSILGHEIGHAIFSCASHQRTLTQALKVSLCASGSIFESSAATAAWLYRADAPHLIKLQLQQLQGVGAIDYFQKRAKWDAWIEELLCDAIGVLTFGPSFIAAECNLFEALDPTGMGLGPEHPPSAFRISLMLRYAEKLGYIPVITATTPFANSLAAFWTELSARKMADSWHNSVPDALIDGAVAGFSSFVALYSPAAYTNPDLSDIESLYQQILQNVPPVGFRIEGDAAKCREVEFRHTLYAGWIATKAGNGPDFPTINKLCEHGIMQQRGIDLQLRGSVSP